MIGTGVSTNGLVFCVDSFNVKSYTSSVVTQNLTGTGSYTLSNGVSFDGRDFTFDGIDDNIIVGNLGNNFTSVTLNIWFNSSSITDYKNLIDFNGFNTCIRIEQYTTPGYFGAWSNLGGGSGNTRMSISINGSGDSLGIGGDLPGVLLENTWYNLIFTYNTTGQKVDVFLNGVKIVNQYTCVSPFVGYINDMRIGDGYDYSSRRFQGKISYVGLYNRSISDTEALSNYNTLKWRFI